MSLLRSVWSLAKIGGLSYLPLWLFCGLLIGVT